MSGIRGIAITLSSGFSPDELRPAIPRDQVVRFRSGFCELCGADLSAILRKAKGAVRVEDDSVAYLFDGNSSKGS